MVDSGIIGELEEGAETRLRFVEPRFSICDPAGRLE